MSYYPSTINEKIQNERLWLELWHRRAQELTRLNSLSESRPHGYGWRWLGEDGVYTLRGKNPGDFCSLGEVFAEMRGNSHFVIVNLDTDEDVYLRSSGFTAFYPRRCIWSSRRKEYQPGTPRRYSYLLRTLRTQLLNALFA